MPADAPDGVNPSIDAALEAVLGNPDAGDEELYSRLSTVVRNCVSDNYDVSDVRAVILLAFADDVVAEDGDVEE